MISVIFSTVTGNGYKLAEAAASVIDEKLGPYNIRYINDEIIERFDTFVITYWCDKGTADSDVINLISKMKNKNIIILGTLGADINSSHAKHVVEKVETLVKENNNLIGHFLCRGSIDLVRTFQKLKASGVTRGHMTLDRFINQIFSQNHPNNYDLQQAAEFTIRMMQKLGVEKRVYATD